MKATIELESVEVKDFISKVIMKKYNLPVKEMKYDLPSDKFIFELDEVKNIKTPEIVTANFSSSSS